MSERWSKVAGIALLVLVIALFGQFLQQVGLVSGNSAFNPEIESIRAVAFESGWGRLWTSRVLATLGIGVLLFMARQTRRSSHRASDEVAETVDNDEVRTGLIGESKFTQIAAVLGLVFLSYVTGLVLRDVFSGGPVDSDKICGALSAYLLMGLGWAFAYSVLEHFEPGSPSAPRAAGPGGSAGPSPSPSPCGGR